MQKIKKKYDDKVAKITGRISSLEAENIREEESIIQLQDAYTSAVIEDDPSIPELKKHIAEKREAIADRTEQIELLKGGNHPVLKQAANDAVQAYSKEREKHEARGEKLSAEAQKAKAVYLDTLAKAYTEDKQNLSQRSTMRSLLRKADDEVVTELLLDIERDYPREVSGFFNWHDCLVSETEVYIAARKYQ